jgi:hypothetical protein
MFLLQARSERDDLLLCVGIVARAAGGGGRAGDGRRRMVSSSGSRRRRDDIKRISLQRNALLFVGAVALPCARLLLDIRHQKKGSAPHRL